MKERIQKLADGIFEYDSPKMAVSTTSVKEVVEECAYFSGSFFVESLSDMEIEGTVIPSHVRMWCKQPDFKGKKCEITYEADLRGLSYGEELKGSFILLTNGGEMTIPCTISVEKRYMDSLGGKLKNLFHFTNFAREDWDGAVKFFESGHFMHLLVNNDRQYRELYQGLLKGKNPAQAMDEFLTVVHKKERALISLTEKKRVFQHIKERERFSLRLEKNTWGYVSGKISVRGSFLEVEKETVSREDFLGNTAEVLCYVNPDQLHGGINTGCVRLETDFDVFVCEIEVDMRKNLPVWDIEERILKEKIALFDDYADFRQKNCTASQFSERALQRLDELESLDSENLLFQLLRIQMLLLGKKEQEAEWHLNIFEDGEGIKEKDEAFYGYFLYLQTCIRKDGKLSKKAQETVQSLYKKQRDSFLLLWIRMYMEEELSGRIEEKWHLLGELFGQGLRSPLLYLEAWDILKDHDDLLKTLDEFTVQTLCFAVKRGMFADALSERVLSLSLKGTVFSQAIFKIYTKIYEMNPSKERLSAVIKLLIRGQKTGGSYTAWYLLGIQQNLKIAGLFENYIESVDWKNTGELPRNLLLYYAMDSSLVSRKRAWIYEQILHRKSEMQTVYKQHKKKIEEFRRKQLKEGAINVNLAALYEAWLEEELGLAPKKRDEDLADAEELLFWQHVSSERKNLVKVLVIHRFLNRVEEYPYRDEGAYVPIYTEEDRILLVNKEGRCFAREEDYTLKPLLKLERYASLFAKKSLGMRICGQLGGERYRIVTPDNEEALKFLLREKDLQSEIRQEIMEKLLIYYKNSRMVKELDALLVKLKLEDFSDMARGRILEFMLAEGLYEEAWPAMQEYGFSELYGGKLVGILGWRIREAGFEWEAPLLKMCSQVFVLGKYNDDMLIYLMRHARMGSRELLKLFQAASGFGEDTVQFSESLIRQVLFTGIALSGVEEAVKELMEKGGNPVLVRAYLAREAYQCIALEKPVPKALFDLTGRILREKKKLPAVCQAVWLKGISEGKDGQTDGRTEGEADRQTEGQTDRQLLEECVRHCQREGLVFPFFSRLEEASGVSLGLEQLEVISHRAQPGKRIALHSILKTGREREDAYLLEPMEEPLPGVYIKQIQLFCGERFRYSIMEEGGEAPDASVQREIIGRGPKRACLSRKNLLGRIAEADAGEEKEEGLLLKLLEEYISLDYMTERYFKKK